ncbi:MAG: hypothetical protein HC905_12175 [Bacteroidales bacterium]|nr:hypothetical protein [Bacteroidales bacterium]
MSRLITSIIALLWSTFTYTQSQNSFIVKSDIPLNKQINYESQYLLPQFKPGHVIYKDLQTGDGNMNYNFLLNEMQFIDNSGKVLAIANPEIISLITIDSLTFIYTPKGYFQVLKTGKVQWLLKIEGKILVKGKSGAYGQISGTAAISTLRNIGGPAGRRFELSETTEVQVTKEHYYWLAEDNKLVHLTHKNIQKMYPKHKEKIVAFITDNKLNINKGEDIKTLMKYCEMFDNGN